MKRLMFVFCMLLPAVLFAQEDVEQKVLSPIKKMIGSVRYSDKAKTPAERKALEDKALDNIGTDLMAQFLLGNFAAKATPEQKKRLADQIREYTRYKAFPLVIKYFKDIDLTYEPPVIQGETARVPASVVYAGSERLSFTFVLTKVADAYVMTDFINDKGISSMTVNRDNQVQPTLKSQGINGLLVKMDAAVAQAKKQAGR
jgi:ABC-type transporter MlaC component